MTRDEALARTDLPGLLDRLGSSRGLGARGKRYPCPNPLHEQTGASPPVYLNEQGAYALWCCPVCDAGGTAIDALVTAGAARDVADALAQLGVSDRPSERDRWTMEDEYVYHDEAGAPIFKVVRYTGKQFRQQRFTGSGWEWGMQGVTRQLFKLPDVLAAKERGDFIFLTEGEKDALAVQAAGHCATTMPGGAGKWEPQYTATLTGCKVIILADDDEPGRRHAEAVWRELYKVARAVTRLPAEGCKDIADHLAAGHQLTREDLRPLEQSVSVPTLNGNGHRTLTARAFASSESQDKTLLGPLIQRGMVTVLGAQTGEGKTTWAMQLVRALVGSEAFIDDAWRPHAEAERALIVDLEQGEELVKTRLREAGLAQSERVDVLWEPGGIAIDRREEDRAMIRDVLRDGNYGLVVLDPLYQTHLGSANDDQVAGAVMNYIADWTRTFNVATVVPMHARKPPAAVPHKFTKHDLAGSSVWVRMVDFILGLQMRSPGFSQLWFFKDRVGRGPALNSWWGLDFSRENGFQRNHREDKNEIKRAMDVLLNRDQGASRDELMAVPGTWEILVEEALRRRSVHEQDGRYRLRAWDQNAGQGALID